MERRETFALNQLKNAGYTPLLPVSGDFKIIQQDATYVFETGGKSKSRKQLNTTVDGFVLSDDIEVGYHHKIPLYLLGLLY